MAGVKPSSGARSRGSCAGPLVRSVPVAHIRTPFRSAALRTAMESRIARASDSVDAAAELADDATVREQLASIRQGLNALSEDLPAEATPASEVPADETPESDPPADETPAYDVPADATPGDDTELGDRLEEIERQLAQLGDDAEGEAADRIAAARDHLDAFRRATARDWE